MPVVSADRSCPTWRPTHLLVGALLVGALALPLAAAQGINVQILDKPDVVVTTDYEGDTYTSPRYLFSVQAKVTNGDQERGVNLLAVTYLDPSVEGCPEQRGEVNWVNLGAVKNRRLDPGQSITVGGAKQPGDGGSDAYWRLEVFDHYPDQTGGERNYSAGEHTFCVIAQVSEDDPACDQPRACWLGKDSFRAYVRPTNQAPWLEQIEVIPEDPEPGDEILFRASATDNDTEPQADQLSYSWELGPDTAEGKVVRHAFNTPGEKQVTLTVTDGFESVSWEQTITVVGQGIGDGGDGTDGAPGPGAGVLILLLALVGATLVSRRDA